MAFNEYLEKATKERMERLLGDEEIKTIFKTPFEELDKRYRNLIPYPGELEGKRL